MSYHGFEVFFLFLSNADSILVRHYNQGVKTVILIDGGRKKHAPLVRKLLQDLGESEIHHLVCTHHHEDHSGGLIELVQDTTLTIRKAWVHLGDMLIDRIDRSRFQAFAHLLVRAQASKDAQNSLVHELQKRNIPIQEPFAVVEVGPLLAVSPTQQFFNAQMELVREESIVATLNERYKRRDTRQLMQAFGFAKAEEDEEEDDGELGAETTSPENEVSVMLLLPWTGADNTTKYFLLTGDAGTAALTDLKARSQNDILKALKWMQIPHHGSRRNVNIELLDYFKPETGFVSAEGSKKHPSTKLVNAVKERGGRVFSTHYPPQKEEGVWLRQTDGVVPEMNTTPAKPLWDAPAK